MAKVAKVAALPGPTEGRAGSRGDVATYPRSFLRAGVEVVGGGFRWATTRSARRQRLVQCLRSLEGGQDVEGRAKAAETAGQGGPTDRGQPVRGCRRQGHFRGGPPERDRRGSAFAGFGHIVNTASVAGLVPTANNCAYSVAKHGVVGLSKTLRIEAKRHGVRVSALCPG